MRAGHSDPETKPGKTPAPEPLAEAVDHGDAAICQGLRDVRNWRVIRVHQPQERLTKQIHRRTDVAGIVPPARPSSASSRGPGRAERRMDRRAPGSPHPIPETAATAETKKRSRGGHLIQHPAGRGLQVRDLVKSNYHA